MNAWAESSFDASVVLSPLINYSDPIMAPLLTIKKTVQLGPDLASASESTTDNELVEALLAVCEGDLVSFESAVRSNPSIVSSYYPSESSGVTCLIMAVVLNHFQIAESLLANHGADPDENDTAGPQYTPLMWAVHLNYLDMVKLLLDYQADPYLSPRQDDHDAVLMVSQSNLQMYDFFKSHNLFRVLAIDEADVFHTNTFGPDESVDDISYQIRMQTLGNNVSSDSLEEAHLDEEAELSADAELVQTPEYDYKKLLPEQFIKFSDSDIPSLLDYIFGLRSSLTTYQHATKVPAAIVFQLIRYSHFKVDSQDLSEFLFECFVTRLRSVTNTKSGVFNMSILAVDGDKAGGLAGGAGDIVLLSYWLSVIQFLHFYFVKSNLYAVYPKFLQELINLTQSLVATLSFSLNSRLNGLVDDCLINFTNLVDVSSVLYAKDWNLFKNKNKMHPSSYDDILQMLFPPNQAELMRPSPLRYVQVLGALDYVLKLHAVDPLLRFQTFSQVFYYINATIFNRLISTSKNCSRAKAIQIRLNISTLEDWLRSHNYRIYKPDNLGGLSSLLGEQKDSFVLKNLLDDTKDDKNPHSSSFYYKSLYHIGKEHLLPTIELLQWLQVMSGLQDEESLINTINLFDALNYYQIFKLTNKLYRYEVEEKKIAKPLVQYLRRLMAEQGEKQVSNNHLHYMTQTNFLLKEEYIYLNPNYVFAIALPNLNELIVNYGSGIGGVKVMRAKKYQPSLPISVMDDVEEILAANRNSNINDTYDYEEEHSAESDKGTESEDEVREEDSGQREPVKKTFKGDELFKQMQPPLSLAHKNWGQEDIDSNPW